MLASAPLGCLPSSTGPQQATTFAGAKRPELSCAREGAERVDVGSWRGTGRPDVARVYKREGFRGPSVLTCREVDLNGDGRKDLLVYFEADGRKQREEFDHDYDGMADVKSYYEQGKLVRQELDVNHDGKADVVEHYESGKMVRKERVMPELEGEKSATAEKAPDKAAEKAPEKSIDRSTDKPAEKPSEKPTAPPFPAAPSTTAPGPAEPSGLPR